MTDTDAFRTADNCPTRSISAVLLSRPAALEAPDALVPAYTFEDRVRDATKTERSGGHAMSWECFAKRRESVSKGVAGKLCMAAPSRA